MASSDSAPCCSNTPSTYCACTAGGKQRCAQFRAQRAAAPSGDHGERRRGWLQCPAGHLRAATGSPPGVRGTANHCACGPTRRKPGRPRRYKTCTSGADSPGGTGRTCSAYCAWCRLDRSMSSTTSCSCSQAAKACGARRGRSGQQRRQSVHPGLNPLLPGCTGCACCTGYACCTGRACQAPAARAALASPNSV